MILLTTFLTPHGQYPLWLIIVLCSIFAWSIFHLIKEGMNK